MKKWLVVLLIFITAAGSFVPCCAANDGCAGETSSTSHKGSRGAGACSPFFACATCAASIEITRSLQLTAPAGEQPEHHEQNTTAVLSTYTPSFWQPPRSC